MGKILKILRESFRQSFQYTDLSTETDLSFGTEIF